MVTDWWGPPADPNVPAQGNGNKKDNYLRLASDTSPEQAAVKSA